MRGHVASRPAHQSRRTGSTAWASAKAPATVARIRRPKGEGCSAPEGGAPNFALLGGSRRGRSRLGWCRRGRSGLSWLRWLSRRRSWSWLGGLRRLSRGRSGLGRLRGLCRGRGRSWLGGLRGLCRRCRCWRRGGVRAGAHQARRRVINDREHDDRDDDVNDRAAATASARRSIHAVSISHLRPPMVG